MRSTAYLAFNRTYVIRLNHNHCQRKDEQQYDAHSHVQAFFFACVTKYIREHHFIYGTGTFSGKDFSNFTGWRTLGRMLQEIYQLVFPDEILYVISCHNGAYSMETKMVEPYHFRKVSASRL